LAKGTVNFSLGNLTETATPELPLLEAKAIFSLGNLTNTATPELPLLEAKAMLAKVITVVIEKRLH
jgi:hypothetical protein